MTDNRRALIIGGGPAGLAAGKTLARSGIPFTLVTDRLGGRMYHSPDGRMNLGATYLNDDYRHLLRHARRGQQLRIREIWSVDGDRLTRFCHPGHLRFAVPMARLLVALWRLRKELRSFRLGCEFEEQAVVLERCPFMRHLSRQSVAEFVDCFRIHVLYESFFRYVFLSTCFAEPEESNALFFLGTLLPLITPTYMVDFTGTLESMTSGFVDRIRIDRVESLTRVESGFRAGIGSGETIHASHAILALPWRNASLLYPVPRPKMGTQITVLYIRGRRRWRLAGKRFVLLDPHTSHIGLIWKQECGCDLVFSSSPSPDLAALYSHHVVEGRVTWKTAVVLSSSQWIRTELAPNLYLAGDYNVCGLEDSYISGRFAANRVIQSMRGDA